MWRETRAGVHIRERCHLQLPDTHQYLLMTASQVVDLIHCPTQLFFFRNGQSVILSKEFSMVTYLRLSVF